MRVRVVRLIAAAAAAIALVAGGCATLAEKERELTFRIVQGDASWFSGLPDGVRELDIPLAHGTPPAHIHAWWWPAAAWRPITTSCSAGAAKRPKRKTIKSRKKAKRSR